MQMRNMQMNRRKSAHRSNWISECNQCEQRTVSDSPVGFKVNFPPSTGRWEFLHVRRPTARQTVSSFLWGSRRRFLASGKKKNQTQGAVNEVTEIGCVPFEWLVFFFHYFTDFCCLVLWACAVPNPISFIGSLMVQLGSTLFLFDSIAYFSLVWRSICCFSFISSYFFAKFCGSSVAINEMIQFFFKSEIISNEGWRLSVCGSRHVVTLTNH